MSKPKFRRPNLASSLKAISSNQCPTNPWRYNGDFFNIGILSNAELFLWAATVGICLFGAAVIRASDRGSNHAAFLTCSGLFTLWLLMDDAFLMHERLFPNHLHMPEMAVYVGYAGVAGMMVLWFRRQIVETHYSLLIIAMGVLATSLAIELGLAASEMRTILEDGIKFLGIIGWLTYHCDSAAQAIPRWSNDDTARPTAKPH